MLSEWHILCFIVVIMRYTSLLFTLLTYLLTITVKEHKWNYSNSMV